MPYVYIYIIHDYNIIYVYGLVYCVVNKRKFYKGITYTPWVGKYMQIL